MVDGGPYKLMHGQTFLSGHKHYLQLSPPAGLFLLRCNGSETRRRNQSVRCKLGSFGDKANAGKKGKRKLIDANGTGIPKSPEPGNVSSQSAASPASEMDLMEEEEAEIDVDDDDELRACRGLVLDVAYRPINVINWKRALCLDILEKADVLEYYDQVIYSPNRVFFIPAVLKVNNIIHTPRGHHKMRVTLNRKNIFMRDKYRCQYCNAEENLTIDHVYAASRGGGWTWENLVTACATCNVKKGSKTMEEAHMTLIKAPKVSVEREPFHTGLPVVRVHLYQNGTTVSMAADLSGRFKLFHAGEPKLLEEVNLPPNYKTYRSLRVKNRTPPEWLDYLPKGIGMTMFQ